MWTFPFPKRHARALVAVAMALVAADGASAAVIQYSVNSLGGISWQYTYTITNDTLGSDLEEFTVFFQEGVYENLAVTGAAPNWDPIVIEPDLGIPASGFFDALALMGGIPVNGTLGGFSVSFDYLGIGTPGDQAFEIIDPATFATIESGTTAVVPAPAAVWLLGSALLWLGAWRRR